MLSTYRIDVDTHVHPEKHFHEERRTQHSQCKVDRTSTKGWAACNIIVASRRCQGGIHAIYTSKGPCLCHAEGGGNQRVKQYTQYTWSEDAMHDVPLICRNATSVLFASNHVCCHVYHAVHHQHRCSLISAARQTQGMHGITAL